MFTQANLIMKPRVALVLFLFAFAQLHAQKQCCSSTQLFADLGSEEVFQSNHQLPKTAVKGVQKGAWISFEIADEADGRGYMVKSARPSNKYLFIFHEWWGLNENIVAEAEKWAIELQDVNVIALDLYDGKVATTREAATEFMQGADEIRIRGIIEGATEFAGPKAAIATLGWCFGGGWSMQAALQIGDLAQGCVVYYGMPEQDTTLLKGLNCKVLGIFAEKDKWINRKVVASYEHAMNAEKKPYETYWYNADHAFANPSNPIFDEVAAKDANEKTRQYLHIVFD